MCKKVITILLSLCLIFSISAMAVTAAGEMPQGGMPPRGEMPQGEFSPPEGVTPPEGVFTSSQGNESGNEEATAPQTGAEVAEENQETPGNNEESGQVQGGNAPFGGGMPEGMGNFPGNMQSGQNTAAEQSMGFLGFVKTYSTPITSLVLLGLAFIFVIFYRRKNY